MRIATRARNRQESTRVNDTVPDEARPEPPTRAGSTRRRWAGWFVAVAAAVVAAVALTQWLQLASRSDERAEAARVAGTVFAALTNWEADGLDDVGGRIDGLATDRFQDEARTLLDDVAQGLAQAEARSTGEVLDLAVEIHDGSGQADRSAAALAVVRQEIVNAGLDAPRSDCWGARAVLIEVDGRWLVDALELYGPNACPEGA